MEDIKSLVTKKPTTNEQLEKQQNLSPQLSKRQAAIAGLIQQTQTRRGLPLISAGFELRNALMVWESALKIVPDSHLSPAYERAAENWPWLDGKAFTPDAVAQAFNILVVEERQRAEAERRNAQKQNPDTYKCKHCQDIGYQSLYTMRMQRWYTSQRPCVCEAAPIEQRSQIALEPPEWVRSKFGEWARRADLEKHGAPSKAFEQFITTRGE